MFNLNEYKNILDKTVIPISWNNEKKNNGYSEISNYILGNIPDEIYRFRNCNERSIEQFYKSQISFSVGSEMNDDFDARVYYDKQELIDWLKNGYHTIINADIPTIKQVLLELSVFLKQKINVSTDPKQIEQISEESLNKALQMATFQITDNFDYWLESVTSTIQNSNKFACFCADIASDIMWGHYANSSRGFALGYRFKKQLPISFKFSNGDSASCDFYPIYYGSERLDATEYMKQMLQVSLYQQLLNFSANSMNEFELLRSLVPNFDDFMARKIALYKSSEWSYEQEWRMFVTSNNSQINSEKYSVLPYKASSLYLGRKISPLFEKILTDIAKEQDIPVYKMEINDNDHSYRLKYVEYKAPNLND